MSNELAPPAENPLAILGQMKLDTIDPEKVEKLLALQERWEDRQAAKAHAAALVNFQAEMPPVFKGRDVQGKYQYASYDDIMKVARPILQRNGLAVSFPQTESGETITIICRISHKDGHATETPLTIPKVDKIQTRAGQDVTNVAQAMGSTIMYGKRYCLCNALDIVVTGEDDDAQTADMPLVDQQTGDEIATLLDQAEEAEKGAKAGALKYFEAANAWEIKANRASEAIDLLNKKIRRAGR